ncbi:hypothetical protein O3P69_012050 [Scylla paramamosain]|uniref:Secreted protein n=1 Tax=Scylla paramamosain TaxID=85552 RepID=A0AAW0SBR7_SCYPA
MTITAAEVTPLRVFILVVNTAITNTNSLVQTGPLEAVRVLWHVARTKCSGAHTVPSPVSRSGRLGSLTTN